mmetsp:Transcript_56980/g.152104  ORF Transcript_56980/g.152104 Transcript_56980/m.152104 type:complete len:240 (+) Transcript_56980:93-812(+)
MDGGSGPAWAAAALAATTTGACAKVGHRGREASATGTTSPWRSTSAAYTAGPCTGAATMDAALAEGRSVTGTKEATGRSWWAWRGSWAVAAASGWAAAPAEAAGYCCCGRWVMAAWASLAAAQASAPVATTTGVGAASLAAISSQRRLRRRPRRRLQQTERAPWAPPCSPLAPAVAAPARPAAERQLSCAGLPRRAMPPGLPAVVQLARRRAAPTGRSPGWPSWLRSGPLGLQSSGLPG